MSKVVHKYEIRPSPEPTPVEVPSSAQVVHVGLQDGALCVWIELVKERATVRRHFGVFPTGHNIPDFAEHVGTVTNNAVVGHVYEIK